jgi:hypothetical protein
VSTNSFSDASGTGYGCYIVEIPIDIAHGMWLNSEKGTVLHGNNLLL